MFCPQCGSNQSDDLKFCKGCGTNLLSVKQALTGREAGEKFDWSKTWVAEMLLSEEEQRKRTEERERQLGITPEVKRYNEIKAGVITSSIGLGVMIFLYIFMQGLVLSGNIPPSAVEIISRVWVAGIIPFLIGLGILFNGIVVSKRLVDAVRQHSLSNPTAMEGREPHVLPSVNTAEFIPSDVSVTEGTTKHLMNPEQKQ